MNISQIEKDNQRTSEWRIERLGKFTGSRIGDLMVSGRSKNVVFGATALAYIYELMSERNLSSEVIGSDELWDEYVKLTTATSKAMQFGTDNEADAINAFTEWLHSQESVTIGETAYNTDDLDVVRMGSMPHPTIENFAASPDALVYVKSTGEVVAVVETKVPLPKTFMQYRFEVTDAASLKATNDKYYFQVHAEMMVSETRYAFFAAYQPFLNDSLHVAGIEMNDATAKDIEERIALAEEFIAAH